MGKLITYCAGASIEVLPGKKVRNILVNPFDNGMNQTMVNYTKIMFSYAETENRFQDSGGYQLYKAEIGNKTITSDPSLPLINSADRINISPHHVIETACKLEPNFMTSLDFPVRKISDKQGQKQEFLRKLGFNVVWAAETASLKKKYSQAQLLIPIQCYDLEQFELFNTLIQHISYDGLSMPLRNLKPPEIALFLFRFYQLGIKKVHLLGSTSFFTIGLAAFFAHRFFDLISLDATTWRIAAEYESYLNPNDLTAENVKREVLIDENIPIICDCPFCEGKTFTFIKNLPYTDKVSFLRGHNFCVTEKAAEDLYATASDLPAFHRFLKQRSPKIKEIDELVDCLSIIDFFKKKDISVLKPYFKIAT